MTNTKTTQVLLDNIDAGWRDLMAYLDTLTPEQRTQFIDAAEWTIKDHVIHMAMWENGVNAILAGESRLAAMGIPEANWDIDIDEINDIMRRRFRDMPWNDVLETFRRVHADVIANISRLSDDDLLRPYRYYQPESDRDDPVVGSLKGNTYEHYNEHLPWMQAIAAG